VGLQEVEDRGRYLVILGRAPAQFVRDVHGHVTAPAFGNVKGHDPDRIVILALYQMPDQRLAFLFGSLSHTRRRTATRLCCDVDRCADYRCSHSIAVGADRWADDVRLSDIEDRFTCTACGKRGAGVRPDFNAGKMATAMIGYR
jgi:hypothetical protein